MPALKTANQKVLPKLFGEMIIGTEMFVTPVMKIQMRKELRGVLQEFISEVILINVRVDQIQLNRLVEELARIPMSALETAVTEIL